jgi:hypothetical protein
MLYAFKTSLIFFAKFFFGLSTAAPSAPLPGRETGSLEWRAARGELGTGAVAPPPAPPALSTGVTSPQSSAAGHARSPLRGAIAAFFATAPQCILQPTSAVFDVRKAISRQFVLTCSWQTLGSASLSSSGLQLTPNARDSAGAAWLRRPLDLRRDFVIYFEFEGRRFPNRLFLTPYPQCRSQPALMVSPW